MATTYDKASLVMIPSGVKEDKLYSIKPTDGSGDFTFSRGSDIQATRVNSSGLIEKAKVNNLLQSNNFDTTWTTTNASVTGGQSGYDGSNDAWEFEATSTSSCNIIQNVSQSGVQNFSIYAKAGTTDWLRIIGDASTDYLAFFDLTNGVVGATLGGANIDTNIESVGGGWYRCSISGNASITRVILNIASGNNDISTTTGDNIYIQDAQLNYGLIAQDYVETTTTAVVEGLTADLPRLDYSGGASCPSLLLEPSRTNKFLYSEYYGSGALSIYATGTHTYSVTNNYAVSPEGVQNAIRFVADVTSANDRVVLRDGVSCGGGNHTLTFYAKSNTADTYTMAMHFDGSGKKQIEVTPEWQRFEYAESANATCNAGIECRNASGYSSSVDVSVYGFQLEENLYPTSYIPTYSAAANRGNETAITAANTLGGLSEGTFFIEMTRQGIDTNVTGSAISLRDNAGAEELRLHFDAPASQVRWRDGNNSFAQIGGALAVTAGTAFKILIKSDGTIAKVFGNGAQLGSDYSIVSAFDFQRIYNYQLGYEIKQQLFFPTALTDAEAIALTTI